jgi:undecaprenyl diphosphate synthase
MGAIQRLYEKRLMNTIEGDTIAKHIILVLWEDDLLSNQGMRKLRSFIDWCDGLGIEIVGIYVSIIDDEIMEMVYPKLRKAIFDLSSDVKADFFIHSKFESNLIERGAKMRINVSIGFGGREELMKAFQSIMKDVESGEIDPEEIDEEMIESQLIFKSEPNLIIRSGGMLTDFLIWQSIYSELYFIDVNWSNFRKIDLLRALRNYQERKRRFGR